MAEDSSEHPVLIRQPPSNLWQAAVHTCVRLSFGKVPSQRASHFEFSWPFQIRRLHSVDKPTEVLKIPFRILTRTSGQPFPERGQPFPERAPGPAVLASLCTHLSGRGPRPPRGLAAGCSPPERGDPSSPPSRTSQHDLPSR